MRERWCRAGLLFMIASATACGDDAVEPEARNALSELVVEGDQEGRIRFTWVMGTAGLDHRVRAYMVGEADDTVSVDITATALPPDGAAPLRP